MRRQAGANLGQLAALSPRVDQLAGEQLASALHAAEPALKEGYAAALRGSVSSVLRPGFPTLSRPSQMPVDPHMHGPGTGAPPRVWQVRHIMPHFRGFVRPAQNNTFCSQTVRLGRRAAVSACADQAGRSHRRHAAQLR